MEGATDLPERPHRRQEHKEGGGDKGEEGQEGCPDARSEKQTAASTANAMRPHRW